MSDDLRDRLAAAVRPFVDKGGTWSKERQAVDAVLAVLQEDQDAYEATTEQQLQDTLRHLGRAERARARYRLAWQSARFRAQAYGEGILRAVDDRDAYKGWMEQAQAEVIRLTGLLSEYSDRAIANGQRAEKAEAAVARVRLLHQRCTCRRELDLSLAPIVHCDCCDENWPCSTIQILDRPELGAALAGPAGAGSTQDGA